MASTGLEPTTNFGDQILQINGENVAGFSSDKVHDMLRKSSVNNITMVIRDRPFERTLTLHKVRKMPGKQLTL